MAHTRHMREACGFPSVGSRAVLVGIPEGCPGRREGSGDGRVSRPKAQNALLSVGPAAIKRCPSGGFELTTRTLGPW